MGLPLRYLDKGQVGVTQPHSPGQALCQLSGWGTSVWRDTLKYHMCLCALGKPFSEPSLTMVDQRSSPLVISEVIRTPDASFFLLQQLWVSPWMAPGWGYVTRKTKP